jgi:hypothetical protein
MAWNSKIVKDGKLGKLSPEQFDSFFQTQFYKKMEEALAKKWPLSDPKYGEMYNVVRGKNVSTSLSEEELQELVGLESSLEEVD